MNFNIFYDRMFKKTMKKLLLLCTSLGNVSLQSLIIQVSYFSQYQGLYVSHIHTVETAFCLFCFTLLKDLLKCTMSKGRKINVFYKYNSVGER
jgi:hypothetical protein